MAVRFKDYNLINNQLLEEIRRQNLELRDKYSLDRRQAVDSHNGLHQQPEHHLSLNILAMLSENTGYRGDEEEFSKSVKVIPQPRLSTIITSITMQD